MKLISCIREKRVVHQYLFEQCNDTAAVHQVIYLIDAVIGHVRVVLITTGTGNSQVEHLHHRNPVAIGLGHLLGHALFPFKRSHICLASSRLRFM